MLEQLGLTLVTIPLPFRLDHVNCFLAEGEDGWVIVDTGLNRKESEEIWNLHLKEKKVTDIYITHYHPDHYGYAGTLQQKTNAHLSMIEGESKAAKTAWDTAFINDIHNYYLSAGVPGKLVDSIIENTKNSTEYILPHPKVNHFFKEGEKVKIGKYVYEIILVPGHAEGLICFYNSEQDVLLSTDHILGGITPNISYWFYGDQNPLQTYIDSLNKIKKLDVDLVIPSHGKPFHGANERIDEIISHHEKRLNQTLESIGEGAAMFDVCRNLFNKDLTVHEYRFAIGETLAHLEFLRNQGDCYREESDGGWRYYKS